MPRIELVGLNPEALSLPAPEPDQTYAIYALSGFSESGIHAFLRLVPALGQAMAASRLPLHEVDRVARVAAAMARALEDGSLDVGDLVAAALSALAEE